MDRVAATSVLYGGRGADTVFSKRSDTHTILTPQSKSHGAIQRTGSWYNYRDGGSRNVAWSLLASFCVWAVGVHRDSTGLGELMPVYTVWPSAAALVSCSAYAHSPSMSAAATLFSLIASAHADSTPGYIEGDEFQVNSFTMSHQSNPSVAALPTGFVVAWTSIQDGSFYGIYGQRFNLAGSPQGDEFQVNSHTLGTQAAPSVTTLSDGFVIAWQSAQQDLDGYGIYGQRFNLTGTPQGDEFQVNAHAADDQLYPSIIALSDDSFVITWQSDLQDGSGYGVYAQRYNVAGDPLGDEFQINSHTTDHQRSPSITALPGGFVVAWQSDKQDGDGYGIFGQRFNLAGTPQGNEFQVNVYTTDYQTGSVMATISDGFVVVWESSGQDGNSYGVYARRYNLTGTPQGSEFRVNSYTNGTQWLPSIAALPDGFVVAWESSEQDGGDVGIYAQRYDLSGSPQGNEFQVNTHTMNNQQQPSVAGLSSGFVITWQSDEQDGDVFGVFARVYIRAAPASPAPSASTQSPTALPTSLGATSSSTVLPSWQPSPMITNQASTLETEERPSTGPVTSVSMEGSLTDVTVTPSAEGREEGEASSEESSTVIAAIGAAVVGLLLSTFGVCAGLRMSRSTRFAPNKPRRSVPLTNLASRRPVSRGGSGTRLHSRPYGQVPGAGNDRDGKRQYTPVDDYHGYQEFQARRNENGGDYVNKLDYVQLEVTQKDGRKRYQMGTLEMGK